MVFTVRQPTALTLCELYHLTGPQKICHLRPDSLAFMLNMANVHSLSRCLVVEQTKGLVVGALCERQVAYTLAVSLTTEDQFFNLRPQTDILLQFNFDCQMVRKVGRMHASMLNVRAKDPLT